MRITVTRIAMFILLLGLFASGCATREIGAKSWFSDCPTCPAMMLIPAGSFQMGFEGGEDGRPEGPVRRISIAKPFAVSRYEVTHAQFREFAQATRRDTKGGCRVWKGEWGSSDSASWRDPGYGRPPLDDEPVACVSWIDAHDYAEWLTKKTGESYRLLTEAEWEYVARAGSTTSYPWGEKSAEGCRYANIYDSVGAAENEFSWQAADCDDGHGQVAPVGSYEPNSFGLYDVVGNVWEWVADCYVAPYPSQPTNGDPVTANQTDDQCARRSVRGGSWITRPARQRPSFRGRDPEDRVLSYFGFRVAKDWAGGTPP